MRRIRHWKTKILSAYLVALLVISLFPMPASTQSNFVVNTTTDTVDANLGDAVCADADGNCSLRAAIQESNALPGFPPEEIMLPAGTYILTMGQLEIQNSLFLRGDGPTLSIIDGNGASRIFLIVGTNSPIVNITDVTIQNGQGGINFGTGIRISEGSSLFLANSVVSGNKSAVGGVGITNAGSLTLFRSTVRDNQITGGGGGITGTGAGIFIPSTGVTEIIESTISNNQGIRGGGIANSGRLNITNSTISGNKASVGGGIRNFPSGLVNVSFSTITNNEAGLVTGEPLENRVGGGIANLGQVNMGNTILAGNMDMRTPSDPLFSPDCYSQEAFRFTSFRGNLVGIINENCNFRDTIWGDTRFDLVGTEDAPLNPQLGPLSNNGGSTRTHALQTISPARDNGTGVTSSTFFDCPDTDQRGVPRPQGAACDIGSFEAEVVDTTPPTYELSGMGVTPEGKKFIQITTQDTESGLASVNVVKCDNCTVAISNFTPGTTEPLIVTATKVNPFASSQTELEVIDRAGNSTRCNPVLAFIKIGESETQTFTGLPEAEGKITIINGAPGLSALEVTVNGVLFQVANLSDSAELVLYVSPAMMEGNENTITLRGDGDPGASADIMISQGKPQLLYFPILRR